jgi:hypothetical protein
VLQLLGLAQTRRKQEPSSGSCSRSTSTPAGPSRRTTEKVIADATAVAPSVNGLHASLSRQQPADLVFALDGPKVVQIRGCSPAQFDTHLADLLGLLIGSRDDIPARSASGAPK